MLFFPGVEVPQDFVQDGQIVLNIAPRAVTNFVADNDEIAFSARFGGVPMTIRGANQCGGRGVCPRKRSGDGI